MKSTDVEKLNQIVSRTDKSGNEKVLLLIEFANNYHQSQLKLFIDWCKRPDSGVEIKGMKEYLYKKAKEFINGY